MTLSETSDNRARPCECAQRAIERGHLVLDAECDPARGGGPCKELKAQAQMDKGDSDE